MSLKNTFRNKSRTVLAVAISLSLLLCWPFEICAGADHSQLLNAPQINVVYPKPGQIVTATDSTFILGNISRLQKDWMYEFAINGHVVLLEPDGVFLVFIPIEPDSFIFRLQLHGTPAGKRNGQEPLTVGHQVRVFVPPPIRQIPRDTLVIAGAYRPPRGDLVLAKGDELKVSFHGTPGYRAWFSIRGVVESVPMAETIPQNQIYWGEAAFGAGKVPDSLLVKGIYAGSWKVPSTARIDTAQIVYHLSLSHPAELLERLTTNFDDTLANWLIEYASLDSIPTDTSASSYKVTLNSPDYPFTVRFTDSVQTVRHGPVRGYLSIFQPAGVEALVVGAEEDWYKVKLSKTQFGWVNKNSVEKLEQGIQPPHSYLYAIRAESKGRRLTIEFPLKGKHPFRVIEENRQTIKVQLFGVTTDTDWIRYDFTDDLIDLVTWSQPEEDLYEVTLELTKPIWGYDSYYIGNTFFLELIKPPRKLRGLANKIIVIDPGHSADPGSIGPSGYTEAEANLAIALAVKDKLESKGARVIMTRRDNSDVPLYDRPTIAKLRRADLFVSIHNNALPDGVNPFTNNGTSTYFYHPHSIDLARSIHKEMLKATGLPDHGFYHGNLAVNRPTQYPAVLVECAFMIIPEQEAMLKTDRFRRRVANAISKGIENFLKELDRKNK